MNMKHTKKLGKRLLASVLSAALLTSTAAVSLNRTPTVKAADNDYYQALSLSLYFFDANACGSGVKDGPLTWRGDCHLYDGKAPISEAVNFDSSMRSLVDPDGDGFVDVDGGYHDAGDHIKFNLTMGFAMSSLAMSEYLNPGVYDKAGCKDHMLAIVRRNADYMMKTTFLDASGNVGTICHVVANGDEDHSYWTAPETQDYKRTTYWLTANSNNSAVCGEMAAALGGAAYLFKDSDPSYAKECAKYAKALINFGTQHVGNENGGLFGFYKTDAQYQDEIAVAEAWLYICGEGAKPSLTPVGGGNYGSAGYDGYRYTWDKVFQGYAALMYKATKDNAFKTELEYEIRSQGGLDAGRYNGDGWGAARYNCALQMSGYAVADGDANSPYATGGKWQMDYILGGNPLGYSFLIGYGNKWPTHYHHRAANPGNGDPAQNPEAKYTLYGALVGGIDAAGNYEDNTNGYQYTEPALDYNGCFALACAGLANLFGGSDKAASKIVSGASEVKYPFSFGNGSTVTPPEPSTTQPTEPTSTDQQPSSTNPPESTPQPTQTTAVQGGGKFEKDASYLEMKNEEGNTYWSFDTTDGTKLTVTMKSNSNDTETNGCWNPPGGWNPDDWETSISGGTFTVTYNVPAGQRSVDFYVWWPTSATLVSAILTGESAQPETTQPTTAATTQPTTQATTQPTTVPTDVQPSGNEPGVSLYGDVDENGTVNLIDVVTLNKHLMTGSYVSDQGKKNADVDRNNTLDAVDSLNILKSCIDLVTLPV